MNCRDVIKIFENVTKKNVIQLERCSSGIANYVYVVSTTTEKFIFRCSKEENAYEATAYWLSKLSECGISTPVVLSKGIYNGYSYLVLSYIPGDDIGNVYDELNENEKKQIAKELVEIQRKVSRIGISADIGWTWNNFIDGILNRADERIKRKHYFDAGKIQIVRNIQLEMGEYLNAVCPTPYLDDISTKNLLIYKGRISGIIDIDWIGLGDMLTFVALTKVALLNMNLDTKYIDYLLNEIHPSVIERRAFVFYCLLYCVDFMGERGMQFLDKKVAVNENIVRRLNNIFDVLVDEWSKCCERQIPV